MSHSKTQFELNGSQCILHADPESATSVNEGVTLIPWMGDNKNLIDRYDVRGHLYSESDFALRKTPTDVDPEEEKLELSLDKERYMFLTVDELEFEAYLEEEEKRFNSKKEAGGSYLQLGFSYSGQAPEETETRPVPTVSEEVYVPDKVLEVPDSMVTPQTLKHYKIIEKTAAFLSTQNLQTELVIRTKQKDNPQFHFLEPDHELNPFYKHVLGALKRKIIVVKSEPKTKPAPKPATQVASQMPSVAAEQHQQMLLAQQQLLLQQQQQMILAQQQQQELERQRLISQQQQQQQNDRGQWSKMGGEVLHSGEAKKGVGSSLAALSAYGAASDSDDSSDSEGENGTPSLSNMFNNMSTPIPVPPGTSPEVIQFLVMSGFVALPPPAPGLPQLLVPPAGYEGFTLPTAPPPPPPDEEVRLTAAEGNIDIGRPPSPSPEQKGIITKLAEYVVKNGDSFERKVLQKQDSRFSFVNPDDEHHSYYQYLIQKFRNKRVKLNVAPIKITPKTRQLLASSAVDNEAFNQTSSEDEEEYGEEGNEEEAEDQEHSETNHGTSQSSSYGTLPSSQSEMVPSSLSQTSSPQPESLSQPLSESTPHQNSDISESSPNSVLPGPQSQTEGQLGHNINSDTGSQPHESAQSPLLCTQIEADPTQQETVIAEVESNSPHPLDSNHGSPLKHSTPGTPVYTNETSGRTPSPTRTPTDDRTQTPEIQSSHRTPERPDSEAESVDSETKGKPLVQHFSDESEVDDRYDLDGKRSRSPQKIASPVRSEFPRPHTSPTGRYDSQSPPSNRKRSRTRSRTRSRGRTISPIRTRSKSPIRSRDKSRERSRTKSRGRTRTRSYSSGGRSTKRYSRTPDSRRSRRSEDSDERHAKEMLKKREEQLNKREEELKLKEEQLKKKEEELPEEGEISDNSSRRKQKKHRDKHDSRSSSRSKKKKDRPRKREKSAESEGRPSSCKKQKTEQKDRQKRKRTSPTKNKSETDEWMSEKMKKLSKIELLKEIEDKLEEKRRQKEHQENTSSKNSTRMGDEKKLESGNNKRKKERKENSKENIATTQQNDESVSKETTKDDEKRLAMEKELAEIEAKLQAKKLKKRKVAEGRSGTKTNGHTAKKKDKQDSSRSKKS